MHIIKLLFCNLTLTSNHDGIQVAHQPILKRTYIVKIFINMYIFFFYIKNQLLLRYMV